MQRKGMVFGTFDGLHKGHKSFIEQAKKEVKKLIIIIARNQNVLKIKGKKPKYNEIERLKFLKKQFGDCEVNLGEYTDFYIPIKKYQPNVILLGYDQKANINKLEQRFPLVEIRRMKAYKPEKYKSSIINN